MQTIVSAGVIGLLALWLLATVLEAIPYGSRVLDRMCVLPIASPLIPRWTFFAPNPGVHDHFLLYRYQFEGGEMDVWHHLADLNPQRTLRAVLWNPSKRVNKALTDLAVILASDWASAGEDRAAVKLTIPYLLILNYISGLPHPRGSIAAQFLLMRGTARVGSEEVLFVSALHKLS